MDRVTMKLLGTDDLRKDTTVQDKLHECVGGGRLDEVDDVLAWLA